MTTPRKKFVPRPDQVRIGHMLFKIEYVTEQEWGERFSGYEGEGGLTLHNWALIAIRLVPHISEQNIREVLLHETTHAIWSTSMITHTHENFGEDKLEEGVVSVQSPYLLGVIKDNHALIKYLQDDQEHE
jgi:hypothetical protein